MVEAAVVRAAPGLYLEFLLGRVRGLPSASKELSDGEGHADQGGRLPFKESPQVPHHHHRNLCLVKGEPGEAPS